MQRTHRRSEDRAWRPRRGGPRPTAIELAALDQQPDGELVAVRGTIVCDVPLSGLLVQAQGVYRRLQLGQGDSWIHEAAVDFALEDDRRRRVLVLAAGARWITPERELVRYPAARFAADHIPPQLRALVGRRPSIDAFEKVLRAGVTVEVSGRKTARPDAGGDAGGYREPPQRAALASGADLPLVIEEVRT